MAVTRPLVRTMRKMKPAGIIALDLDGTLLNSQKELSRVNLQVLEKAAAKGFLIVPTTGRFYDAMPKAVKDLPFVQYAITINGAQVQDLAKDTSVYRGELPWQQAVSIMEWLDDFPVIYDCYLENNAFMTAAQKEKIDETIHDNHYRKMFHELRNPVEELKQFVKEKGTAGSGVQKIQFFTADPDVRTKLMAELPKNFEHLAVSSSHIQNVEINQSHANKGEALLALADYLHIPREMTFAFGDGLNDLSMIVQAGWGIAMENACDAVKAAADYVTASCDDDGVAKAIEKLCLAEEEN